MLDVEFDVSCIWGTGEEEHGFDIALDGVPISQCFGGIASLLATEEFMRLVSDNSVPQYLTEPCVGSLQVVRGDHDNIILSNDCMR